MGGFDAWLWQAKRRDVCVMAGAGRACLKPMRRNARVAEALKIPGERVELCLHRPAEIGVKWRVHVFWQRREITWRSCIVGLAGWPAASSMVSYRRRRKSNVDSFMAAAWALTDGRIKWLSGRSTASIPSIALTRPNGAACWLMRGDIPALLLGFEEIKWRRE